MEVARWAQLPEEISALHRRWITGRMWMPRRQFISGILPRERGDKVVYQKTLPNKQGTFDTGQQLTMNLDTTISFLFLS